MTVSYHFAPLPPTMRISRLPAVLFVAAYLAVTAWYLVRQIAGDPGRSPLAYFFTWDMFPSYETESVRRQILGFDAEGRAWRLVPGPGDRFRWGNHGDAARTDLDRRDVLAHRAAEVELRRWRTRAGAPTLVRVAIVERYLPLSQNVDRTPTLDTIGQGEARWYWRTVAEADLDAATPDSEGSNPALMWKSRP